MAAMVLVWATPNPQQRIDRRMLLRMNVDPSRNSCRICMNRPVAGPKKRLYGDDRFGTPLRDDLSFVVLEKNLAVSEGVG
jgi:hypothetical protein